ncbi:hypothetical protein [Bartonella sp. CB169]|uniref:hypothetical protein n=1 Tax=Bartonella sp. CB169 TaxID=3112257 RepID=UPI00300E4D87
MFDIFCRFEPSHSSWMQPYFLKVRQVDGKKIKFSNGKTGDIDSLISSCREVGLIAGHKFIVGTEVSLTAHLTEVLLCEDIDNNEMIADNRNKLIIDLSRSRFVCIIS